MVANLAEDKIIQQQTSFVYNGGQCTRIKVGNQAGRLASGFEGKSNVFVYGCITSQMRQLKFETSFAIGYRFSGTTIHTRRHYAFRRCQWGFIFVFFDFIPVLYHIEQFRIRVFAIYLCACIVPFMYHNFMLTNISFGLFNFLQAWHRNVKLY